MFNTILIAHSGTYFHIETIIEKDLKGLSWETLGGKHSIQTGFFGRLIANAVYPVLLLLNGLSGLYLLDKNIQLGLCILILVILIQVILVLILLWISYKVSTTGREKELDEWKRLISMQ